MTTITPWINFNGNAEEAFTFYKSVFGGEFTKIIRFKSLANPEFLVSDADAEKIMLITLPIGKNNVLMANDVPAFMGKVSENENRSKISISTESKEEAEKIFNALSAGGSVEAPMDKSPWGTYFGMFRDKYGIEWVVEYSPKKYWFKAKLYGWGWVPVTWQGWSVTLAYIALILTLVTSREEAIPGNPDSGSNVLVFALPILILTVLFIVTLYKKGEKPRWQWGSPKK